MLQARHSHICAKRAIGGGCYARASGAISRSPKLLPRPAEQLPLVILGDKTRLVTNALAAPLACQLGRPIAGQQYVGRLAAGEAAVPCTISSEA